MRGRSFGVVLAVQLLFPSASAVAEESIDVLVARLGHPRFAVREHATAAIVAQGEAALPALAAACRSSDPEVRERAEAVYEAIDRARLSRLVNTPIKVRFQFEKTPLEQAVAEVSQKVGKPFRLDPSRVKSNSRPVTLDTGERPVWEAVEMFLQAADLGESFDPIATNEGADRNSRRLGRAGRRVVVVDGGQFVEASRHASRLIDGARGLPADIRGAVRVRALPASFHANKRDPASGLRTLHVQIDALPSVGVLDILGIDVNRAIGDDAREVAVAYPPSDPQSSASADQVMMQGAQVIIVDGWQPNDFNPFLNPMRAISFRDDGRVRKHLAEVRGVVRMRVHSPPMPLATFPSVLTADREYSVDGLSISVTQPSGADSPGTVTVTVATRSTSWAVPNVQVLPRGLRTETGRATKDPFDFEFRDGSGQTLRFDRNTESVAIDRLGAITTRVSETLQLKARPTDPGKVTLTVNGRKPILIDVPFTLKNVPLP